MIAQFETPLDQRRWHGAGLRQRHWLRRLLVPLGAGVLTSGCADSSAPAIVLFGAYFPDWLLFALLAVLVGIVARVVAGASGRLQAIPFPLFTFSAIGILVAGVVALLW